MQNESDDASLSVEIRSMPVGRYTTVSVLSSDSHLLRCDHRRWPKVSAASVALLLSIAVFPLL